MCWIQSQDGLRVTLHNSNLISKSEISTLLNKAKIRPSKKLGQNFLVDNNVLRAIIDEVQASSPRVIVEIGAGLGALTVELAKIAPRVVAIELDHRLAEILKRTTGEKENVEICRKDFLSFSFAEQSLDEKAFVVGNIPYRITAPILKHLITQQSHISAALLLTQHEVAAKIANSPGKDGTSLGVLVQAYADVRILRHVPRTSFFPVPQVDSSLWTLAFLSDPRFSASEKAFFAVVHALYSNRRKMIRRALRDILPPEHIARFLDQAFVTSTLRGEQLSFEELNRIARLIDDQNSPVA